MHWLIMNLYNGAKQINMDRLRKAGRQTGRKTLYVNEKGEPKIVRKSAFVRIDLQLSCELTEIHSCLD